jgi:small subunit ribosomal protein S15
MVKTKTTIEKPVWLKYTGDEVKAIIIKLANQGLTAEKIGLTLRDQYGIPKVKIYGFSIKEVLEKEGKFEEPTNMNLKKKLDAIIGHYKKNKQDKRAERSLIITKAKLKKRDDYLAKKSK